MAGTVSLVAYLPGSTRMHHALLVDLGHLNAMVAQASLQADACP
jgi:hypothetical protein